MWIQIWISKIEINPWFLSSNTLKNTLKWGKKRNRDNIKQKWLMMSKHGHNVALSFYI
jgi:hypothetical protein